MATAENEWYKLVAELGGAVRQAVPSRVTAAATFH